MAMFSLAFDLAVVISVVIPVKTKVCATFHFCIFCCHQVLCYKQQKCVTFKQKITKKCFCLLYTHTVNLGTFTLLSCVS